MLVTSGEGRLAGRERCALPRARLDGRAGAAVCRVLAKGASAPGGDAAVLTVREWPRDRTRGEWCTARGGELWTVDLAGVGVAAAGVAAATATTAAGALAGVAAGAVSAGAAVVGAPEPALGALPDVAAGCVERALLRFADSRDLVGSVVACVCRSRLGLVVKLCGLVVVCVPVELAGSVSWVACAVLWRDLPELCCDASSWRDRCPPLDSRADPARRWPGGWPLVSWVELAAAGPLLGVGVLAEGSEV
ncbi:MAG TPA: hypothetical protein VK778_08750 [Solirubrobacteraceae bacterium]|nr:hypothetical protein [Solirubrobacteraceae bacterium]